MSTPATATLQCRLPQNASMKIIGLGGIGCIVLEFLALFLKGLRQPARLVLIDGDTFEAKNAGRMRFEDLGNKAEIKAAEAAEILDGSEVAVVPVEEYVSSENIERLIVAGDYVFLCVDNHVTRRLVSEHCARLPDITLLSGGNDGVEPPHERGTYGNVQIAIRRGGRDLTAPLTKFHPEIAAAEGDLPGGPSCGQLVASVPQILFTNLAVASAMLNAFFAYTCGELRYQEVKLDILEARSLPQFELDGALDREVI